MESYETLFGSGKIWSCPLRKGRCEEIFHVFRLLERLFYVSTTPFKKYSETLITRLPHSNFYFHPSFMDQIYMALGLWEPYVCHVFTPNKGDIVLDVGAHIGYYTLKAAQAVGPEGIVISVEPDPRNFKILRKNIRSNRIRNVKLVNCALGSSTGYARFKMSSNPSVSQLAKNLQNRDPSSIKVEVKTMDELCEKIGVQRLNWVKIDVEGGASDVLRGGFKTLRHPTRMIIEVQDNETLELLAKLEYSIRPLQQSNSKLGYYYASLGRAPVDIVHYE